MPAVSKGDKHRDEISTEVEYVDRGLHSFQEISHICTLHFYCRILFVFWYFYERPECSSVWYWLSLISWLIDLFLDKNTLTAIKMKSYWVEEAKRAVNWASQKLNGWILFEQIIFSVHSDILTRLTLSHNKITSVPANIADLSNLQVCCCCFCLNFVFPGDFNND